MKVIITISIVFMLLAGVMAAFGAGGTINLSTLGKESSGPAVLPSLTPTMPANYTTTYLGSQTPKPVIDLSTLGKAKATPAVPPAIEPLTPAAALRT